MTNADDTPPPAKVPTSDKQDRLAARLRENLKKRKQQARAREKDEDGKEG